MPITLTSPMVISPRLLPAVRIGDAFISIEPHGSDVDGTIVTTIYIDTPEFHYEDSTLRMNLIGYMNDDQFMRDTMATALSFLANDADRYWSIMGPADPYSYGDQVAEWAYMNDSEIQDLECDFTPEGDN